MLYFMFIDYSKSKSESNSCLYNVHFYGFDSNLSISVTLPLLGSNETIFPCPALPE